MSSIIIKTANVQDWELVLNLEKTARSKFYSTGVTKKAVITYLQNETVFLAYLGNELIGKISYKDDISFIHISGLIVLPKWRGKGYGKLLSQYVINLFPTNKAYSLTVHPYNYPALQIYKQLGFVVVKKVENMYGDGEPRLFMEMVRVKN